MIKLREARYCNLKLFLVFLVIYGHFIEPQIGRNGSLMNQYRWIYLVHMPLFSFLSGLFVHDCHSCAAQLKRIVPLYVVLQMTAVLFGNGMVRPATPWWHLWYLLSYSWWLGMAWMWFRFVKGRGRIAILIIAVIVGCCSGYLQTIGRAFSLSRTIVFFPYFWLGTICDRKIEWRKYKIAGVLALLISIFGMCFLGDRIKTPFLYQADPFGTIENGIMLRALCYLLGVLVGFFLLTFIPERRYCFTKAGANTLPAYIIHAPVAAVLRDLNWSGWQCMLASVVLLWLIYKLFQWHGVMYGIVVPGRRDRRWPCFEKCMKNTDERYMGFCYPYPGMRS